MKTKLLLRRQISQKIASYNDAKEVVQPATGWIKAIRTSLGMSLEQLANKLNVSKQNVQMMERREQQQAITLKKLKEVAAAMDMQLVYALVPVDDSLDAMIERKAEALAKEIVMRTSQTMVLEDQEVKYERLNEAITERKEKILQEMPKALWD